MTSTAGFSSAADGNTPGAVLEELARLRRYNEILRRQNEYLTALHETSLGLLDKLDKQELLQTIIERAARLTGTSHGYIYLLHGNGCQMEMRVGLGFFTSQLGRRVERGEGLGGQVWQTERPVLVDDYRQWPHRLADKVLDGLRCIVGIPIKSESKVIGVIGLAHVDQRRRFEDEVITLLERFAALALIAFEKAALYSEARRELAERKRAEERIRQSQKRYRLFLESSPDPIVVYDMQGHATYVNPAFEQTFGYSRKELLGKQIDFVPPEAWPETRAAIRDMLSGQKINLFETRRTTRDGRKLDVQLSSTLYLNEDGQPVGNIVTLRDISARKRAEEALRNYHDQLEELVDERTAELGLANQQLQHEIEDRKRAEQTLRRRERELQAQSHHLEEVNTALRVLIKQREADKHELEQNVLSNIGELVEPYLERLKKSCRKTSQNTLISIMESNLKSIVSPFIRNLAFKHHHLTPTEIRVANLIKGGKTNKEIAEILLLSKNTVLFHRHNIRKKLALTNQKINLRSHLLTFDE
jgi:PAS domain S-box-containing protein